jgi:hypothetical protein
MTKPFELDVALVEKARLAGKHRSKKEAINAALEEYLRVVARRELIGLFGTVDFHDDFDHSKMRRRRHSA